MMYLKNVLYWRGTTNGDFNVRSVYHMEKERIEMHKGGVSTCYELRVIVRYEGTKRN